MLRRLAAMRGHMRKREVLDVHDASLPESAGISAADAEDMYRLLAIAKYEDRYVIPKAHAELAGRLMEQQGACGLDFEGGPGNCGAVAHSSTAEEESFMLSADRTGIDVLEMVGEGRDPDAAAGAIAAERPAKLDIVEMLGDRRAQADG